MPCDALTLAGDGGMNTLNKTQQNSAIFGILCQILQFYDPMAECNAIELAETNDCFHCLTNTQQQAAIFGVLCNIYDALPGGIPGAGAAIYSGNGDPNGVVSALVGSIYIQLDAPGVAWVKVVGAGTNTGWAVNS